MEINSVGAYSPETVYGQLTSPFVPKTIVVNSKTPFDVVDENANSQEVYSRKYFKGKPYPKIKFEVAPDNEEEKISPLSVKQTSSNNTKNINKFGQLDENTNSLLNNAQISSFSISKLSSKDIVNSSLKLGYSAEEAVVIDNARKAYEKSLLITDNPAETLSACNYRVK